MRLTSPAAIVSFFENRVRKVRIERRNAKLRRELSRLPHYIADDINANQLIESLDIVE